MTSEGSANPENAVLNRYSEGAKAREEALCCPVSFDPQFLKVLPEEIIERDYGCGDPSAYVREGETVLDLGSGAGKICWIAAQIVGSEGRVIGVDMNSDMLTLARQYHNQIAKDVGFDNVTYFRGVIQDLALDLDLLEAELKSKPISGADSWLDLRQKEEALRKTPMIADESVDVVLSNCVLNLVRNEDKEQLFKEIYRVVKTGGRVAISDIVSDEDIPQDMQDDPDLWSGCISGAYREDLFLEAFEEAGFHGVEIVKRDEKPWQTVNGIEFRAVTIQAFKGKEGPCLERNQAVIYNGPFSEVYDDDDQVYIRGQRMAVCDKTFKLLQQPPYAGMFTAISPSVEIPLDAAESFSSIPGEIRDPDVSKGADHKAATASDCCAPKPDSGSSCC